MRFEELEEELIDDSVLLSGKVIYELLDVGVKTCKRLSGKDRDDLARILEEVYSEIARHHFQRKLQEEGKSNARPQAKAEDE